MLTVRQCDGAKSDGKKSTILTDGYGLYLDVRPSGAKTWRYRYRLAGKANIFTIGDYPVVSLAEARQRRGEAAELIKKGINPTSARRIEKAVTIEAQSNIFKSVAERFLAERAKRWAGGTMDRVQNIFKNHVYPAIGEYPIASIKPLQVREMIRSSLKTAPTMAEHSLIYVGQVFRFAIAEELLEYDPTYGLGKVFKFAPSPHHPHLTSIQLPTFAQALYAHTETILDVYAAKLMLFTLTRTCEVLRAEWTEFDLDRALWIVPPERMKMKTPHYVPLSAQAVALLRELHELTGDSRYVFPQETDKTKHAHKALIYNLFIDLGYGSGKLTPHGLRGTASTILYESGYPEHVVEPQLAHKKRNKSRAAYDHAIHMPERRAMLQWWANYIDAQRTGGEVLPPNVVPFRAAA
ncbi:MAG: tyrosine-type recombinase/integrase [Burkholderiales bacterium]|nr:tyrosine-type recombinase/integrase [Burkholderiales bacterium]